jgi:pilus assembly protein Flp/PilA
MIGLEQGPRTFEPRESIDPFLEFPMRSFCSNLVSFLKNEDGPTAVEYAVMLSLIIVVCIAAITTLGSNANQTFSYVSGNVKG